MAKRRLAYGRRNGSAKLTPEAAAEIRQRYAAGESQAALGRAFGITQRAVWQVVHRLTWADAA
jgi:DNA invertase Pin-like site-specific DNA recombinase